MRVIRSFRRFSDAGMRGEKRAGVLPLVRRLFFFFRMKSLRRVGIFGGSFDPVHRGHISLAAAALKECGLDAVVFVPARQPPHKLGRALAKTADRLAMLLHAIIQEPKFLLSNYELRRPAPTYTWQTVRHFKKIYPAAELFFIMGGDSLTELPTWRKAEGLARACTFIVGKRRGTALKMPPFAAGRTVLLRKPLPDISSSDVREGLAAGTSVTRLVPPAVRQYIIEHRLYR